MFTDLSTNISSGYKNSTWAWDINNDGSVDYTSETPTHTYTDAGYYTVNLTVSNDDGTDSEVKINYILAGQLPLANFTASDTEGFAPLILQFFNQSTQLFPPIYAYAWDIDNNGVTDYTTENPIHTYASGGHYTVKFTVTNSLGSNTSLKTDYIYVKVLPVATFVANETLGVCPMAVQFTSTSTPGYPAPMTYKWDINNDGIADYTDENPVHTYNAAGYYTVKLTVTNAAGEDVETKSNYIVVTGAGILQTLGYNGSTAYGNISFYGSADIAGDYWFEFSGTPDGFMMSTKPITSLGNETIEIDSPRVPFTNNATYYYRIARDGGYGDTLTFIADSVAPIPTTTYKEEHYKPFVRAKWNLTELAGIVPVPYFARFGYLLWAIFWGAILMAFWVRQEDVTIPAFIYLIVFTVLNLADWLPSSFVAVSWVFAGICLGAILYTLFRGRKHG